MILLNKKLLKKWKIYSTIFTIILGTFLHFTFNLFPNNLFVASFSAVNESTWEHLKLIFFPMFIFSIIEYLFLKNYINKNNFIFSKSIGIIFSIIFIIIFFYTYTGILGFNISILNILSFLLAVILGEFISYKLLLKNIKINNNIKTIFIIILFLLFFSFILFTYFPPNINLLKDQINNNYGIIKIKNN